MRSRCHVPKLNTVARGPLIPNGSLRTLQAPALPRAQNSEQCDNSKHKFQGAARASARERAADSKENSVDYKQNSQDAPRADAPTRRQQRDGSLGGGDVEHAHGATGRAFRHAPSLQHPAYRCLTPSRLRKKIEYNRGGVAHLV